MQPIAGLEVPVPASCTLGPVGSVVLSICHTKQESVPMTGTRNASTSLGIVRCHCHAEHFLLWVAGRAHYGDQPDQKEEGVR